MKTISEYLSRPFVWWLKVPIYASRIVIFECRRIPQYFGFVAQNGEDRILAKLFKQPRGYCVEVGAFDGVSISNTYYFEKHKRGWKCLLIEADPISAAQCARNRPRSVTFRAAATDPESVGEIDFYVIEHCRSMSGIAFDDFQIRHFDKHNTKFIPTLTKITARTLDSMLEEARFPRVDFITIDVEGHEESVLKGFSIEKWNPKVVVMERLKKEADPYIASYMSKHGYERKFHLPRDVQEDCNDFYFKVQK